MDWGIKECVAKRSQRNIKIVTKREVGAKFVAYLLNGPKV